MGEQQAKVFILSLDGATFDVIDPLVAQGCMPNIGALISQSVASELESVVPPVTAPAWTSFMTGKQPNKHGIFDFAAFSESTYSWSINNASHVQSRTLWQILSDKGKRVVVLNLPYTYPTYEVNGILVSGWDAPLSDASFSYPPEISSEILQMFPDYKTNLWVSELQPLESDEEFDEFVRRLKTGFEQQAKFALELLQRQPWDVFMVHFQQTDWIQHKLWKYIEQACKDPKDDSAPVRETRNCYRRFDELSGTLLERASGIGATTIVLSDHGFGPLRGSIPANGYLQKWGYLSTSNQPNSRLSGLKETIRKSPLKPVAKLYSSVSQAKAKLERRKTTQKHDSWADNAGEVLGARGAQWDWSRTKAAAIYAYLTGFVYVNRVGRGLHGVVTPEEYETLVSDLIRKFRELRHPQTKLPLLQEVVRCSDLYPAISETVLVPDLALIPADGYGFSFSLNDAPSPPSNEGTHRHNGVLIAGGSAIRRPGQDFRPHLVDLAPTVLHLLDLPVPSDMDGRVLEEILVSSQKVRYEDPGVAAPHATGGYSREESELIEQRLKGLGYL